MAKWNDEHAISKKQTVNLLPTNIKLIQLTSDFQR